MRLMVQQHRTQHEWHTLISRRLDRGARANDTGRQAMFEYRVLHFGRLAGSPPSTP